MSALSPYSFERDADTGLMIVKRDGHKVGTAQTPAAARLIARNDRRRLAREQAELDAQETRSDYAAWFSQDT